MVGSAVGPYPYPKMVMHFQSIIGKECKMQLQNSIKSRLYYRSCWGWKQCSWDFYDFIKDENVKLIGIEAGGLALIRLIMQRL